MPYYAQLFAIFDPNIDNEKHKPTSEFKETSRHVDFLVLHAGQPSERRDRVILYLRIVWVRLAHTKRRRTLTGGLPVQIRQAIVGIGAGEVGCAVVQRGPAALVEGAGLAGTGSGARWVLVSSGATCPGLLGGAGMLRRVAVTVHRGGVRSRGTVMAASAAAER